jgi:hypothetical protein
VRTTVILDQVLKIHAIRGEILLVLTYAPYLELVPHSFVVLVRIHSEFPTRPVVRDIARYDFRFQSWERPEVLLFWLQAASITYAC